MSLAKLTLIGMYKYDNDLFNDLSFNGVDKDTLINNILLNGGEFELVYPDLEMNKFMIRHFVHKWSRTISKWVNALNLTYNPIENYDRHEEYTGTETIVENGVETKTNNGNETYINNGNNTLSKNGTDRNESEDKISAYNTSNYQPDNTTSTTITYGSSDITSINSTGTRTPNLTETRTPNLKETRTPDLKNYIHGNIGVITNQQMIRDELGLQVWNLYEHITDLFINEFCIQVY